MPFRLPTNRPEPQVVFTGHALYLCVHKPPELTQEEDATERKLFWEEAV